MAVNWDEFTPVDGPKAVSAGIDWAEFEVVKEPGLIDRVKSALTPDPDRAPMPQISDEINAGWTSQAEPDDGRVSLPGSVMDGYIPKQSDEGVPVESGMGPMRKDYYDQARAGLIAAPVQAHAAAAQAGGQVGRVARDTLPDRLDRLDREATGDLSAKSPQELQDDIEQGRLAARPSISDPDEGLSEFGKKLKFVFSAAGDSDNPMVRGAAQGVAGLGQSAAGLGEMFADNIGDTQLARDAQQMRAHFKGFENAATGKGKAQQDADITQAKNSMPRWIDQGVQSASASIARQLPGLLTGRSGLVLGEMFFDTMGSEYGDARAAGKNKDEALTRASIFGVFEVLGEKLAIDFAMPKFRQMARGVSTEKLPEFFSGLLKREIPGELFTHSGESATDTFKGIGMRQDMTFEQYLSEVPAVIRDTIIQTGMMTGGGGLMNAGIRTAKDRYAESRDITAGMEFRPADIDAAARQSLDPANARMHQTGRAAPMAPPVVTPADILSAPSIDTAIAAAVDSVAARADAALALPATELIDEPITPSPLVQTPSVPSAQPEPVVAASEVAAQPAPTLPVERLDETAVAATPNVDSYLTQNAEGVWKLSQPAPVELRDAVIAEMDRRNQEGSTNAHQAPEALKVEPALQNLPQAAPEAGALPNSLNVGAGATPIVNQQVDNQPKNPEASRPNPVAESQAPAPSEPGDGGVAPTQDKAAPAITRTKAGKLEISGFTREDVAETLKTAKIKATVAVGKDGRVLVSAVGRSGNQAPLSVKQVNAIKTALMGKTAKAPKARKFTGNLRNDVNLIAPGLYAEVARGGDGEGGGFDMSLVAERLRAEGFMLPDTETGKDSDAVIEIIRQDIANGGGTLNEARMTAAMTEAETKTHRANVLRLADEYGIPVKKGIIPRALTDIESDLATAIEQEIGVAGKGMATTYEAAIAAGIPESELDAIVDQVDGFYKNETSPDRWVLQYREQTNALQEAIDAHQERQGRDAQGEGAGDDLPPPQGSEERPALEPEARSSKEEGVENDSRVQPGGREDSPKANVERGISSSVSGRSEPPSNPGALSMDESIGRSARGQESDLSQSQNNNGSESRPALELAGETETEARARLEAQAAAEAQAREEETRAAAEERQARIGAEVAGRQDVAADNFDLTPQVNDKAKQKKADQAEIDRQLAGQGDLLSAPQPKTIADASPADLLRAAADKMDEAVKPKEDAPKPRLSSEEWRNEGMTPEQIAAREAQADAEEFAMQIENDARDANDNDFNPGEIPAALRFRAEEGRLNVDALRTALIAELKKRKPFPFRTDVVKILERDAKASPEAGKPVAALSDDQLRTIARGDEDGADEARAELAKRGLGYGPGNNDAALLAAPLSERDQRIASLLGRGLYELPEDQRASLLKTAKVRSVDAFEDMAISERREIIGRWVDANPAPKETGAGEAAKKPKKPKAADPMIAIREFYTPGNIIHVDYWNQQDKVLAFSEKAPGDWSVTVQKVKKQGDEWVPAGEVREHRTTPGKDRIVDRVAGPAEPANPDAAAIQKADEDFDDALGDLGDILGKNFRATFTPEQEQKILPVLTRLFDAAFRKGYYKFKEAARFVLDAIQSKFGKDVADQITIDHLQGAYIGMSGRYRDQGAEKVGATQAPVLGTKMDWREFGNYLSGVSASDAFGNVDAKEKREWAAAGESWQLLAVDPKTLDTVPGETPDTSSPIIVSHGDVLDGRSRRAEATANKAKAIAAWVASDEKVGAGDVETTFNSLEDDQRSAVSRAIDRAIAIKQGKDVKPLQVIRVRNRIGKLRADLEAGKISEALFISQVESLHAQMEIAAESRKYEPTNGRARGADFLRQKLLEAKRRGDISEQAADMAEWFILKNPALVDDLGIGIRTPKEGQNASGNYNPLNRVMTLFKESASDTTAVHEILHHLERMMPAEMQAEIRKEWRKAATKELLAATKAKDQKRIDYFEAVLAGDQKKATELLTGKGMEGFNAPISDATRAKRIFHSTSTEAAALKILEDGEIRPPDNKHARGKLAPVVGRTYVSPSLETASIYSLGGVMMGHDYNWQGRTDRAAGQYGYIFEIDPSSYGDVQPDEDSVGELAAGTMKDPNRNSDLRWLADLAQTLGTPNQIRDAKFGEYAAWAQLGKKLVKHMSDAQKTLLIDKHDAHIANQGPLKIARAWKVDKSKAKEIARDGSNVLDVAEQVYGDKFNAVEPAPTFKAVDTESDAFLKWFGKSAVVDAEGNPLRVYHGTPRDFSKFKLSKNGIFGRGIYLTTDTNDAEGFSYGGDENGDNIMPLYAAINRPYKIDFRDTWPDLYRDLIGDEPANTDKEYPSREQEKRIHAALVAAGHDGIEVYGAGDMATSTFYIALDPTQVKSATSNTGKFDPTNPDIRQDLAIGQDYQYLNPSEFWAVRMTSTMAARFEAKSIWARSLQWLREALEHIKGALGLKSDHPLLKALDDLIARGTGEFVSKEMLGSSEVYAAPRIIGDSGRQYTPDQEAMFKQTGREVDRVSTLGKLRQWASVNWRQGLFDQFQPVRAISEKGYTLLRLSKGATGAFEAFMQHGKLSLKDGAYDADTTGGVMQEVFFPLGKETTDFLYWIAGNRAERLAMEGKERLFSPQDIAAAKSLAKGTTDFDYVLSDGKVTRDRTLIYRDSLTKFNAFNKNVMDMAEQSGLIDAASRHLWEHEFYVPFYRLVDDTDGGVRGMNIKQGVVRQQAFKKLKGGKEGLNDLLANTLMNWAHLIDASAKNRGAKETLEAAARLGAAQPAQAGDKNTVWYMDGGKKAEYTIDDPELLVALNALDYSGLRGPIMDALQKPKRWLTIGVTASPFFKVRNLIRDSVQAVATSDLRYNIVTNVIEGVKLTNRENQEYVSALAGGGLIRFGTMLEGNEAARTRQLIKKGAKDEHILNNEGKIRAFYDKYLEPGIAAYNEIGNRGEEINRMSLYDQMIKSGADHATASLMARDLMDFSMGGSWTSIRFLAQVVPFFNARLEGMYKLGRAAKGDPAKFGAVLGAASLFSLALLAAYSDDDDWKKREDWDRDNYWWFKVGGVAFRIPKPFEIGAIATLAERSAELMFDKEMTGKRFRQVTTKLIADQLSMNPTPQLVKPILDIYANRDSFSGRPIETMGMERLDKERRFTSSTSIPARGLSTATGGALSPVQIDHLVRGYFAWLGAFAVGAADLAVRAASNGPDSPSRDYWKFATGGMIAETDSASSRYVSQMYDQAKEIETAYGTWRDMNKQAAQMQGPAKQDALKDAQEYRKENMDKISRYSRIESTKRQVSDLNERIRVIERGDRTSSEKRALINNINKLKDQAARRVVATRKD